MTVCLASPLVENWFLRKSSTKPWAQRSDGAACQSWIRNAQMGIQHRACFTLLHASRGYLETLLLGLRIKVCLKILLAGWFSVTQIGNQNRSPAVIFLFPLESTAREVSESSCTGHLVQPSWEICTVFPIYTVQQVLVKAPEEILCNLLSQQSWKNLALLSKNQNHSLSSEMLRGSNKVRVLRWLVYCLDPNSLESGNRRLRGKKARAQQWGKGEGHSVACGGPPTPGTPGRGLLPILISAPAHLARLFCCWTIQAWKKAFCEVKVLLQLTQLIPSCMESFWVCPWLK